MSQNQTPAKPQRATWTLYTMIVLLVAALAGAAAFWRQSGVGDDLTALANARALFLANERRPETNVPMPEEQQQALQKALGGAFNVTSAEAAAEAVTQAVSSGPAPDRAAQMAIAKFSQLRAEFAAMDQAAKGKLLTAASTGPDRNALAELLPSPRLLGVNATAQSAIEAVARTVATDGIDEIGALPETELKLAAEQILSRDDEETQALVSSVEAAEQQRSAALLHGLSDGEATALQTYLEKSEVRAAQDRLIEVYRSQVNAAMTAAIISYVRENPLKRQ